MLYVPLSLVLQTTLHLICSKCEHFCCILLYLCSNILLVQEKSVNRYTGARWFTALNIGAARCSISSCTYRQEKKIAHYSKDKISRIFLVFSTNTTGQVCLVPQKYWFFVEESNVLLPIDFAAESFLPD